MIEESRSELMERAGRGDPVALAQVLVRTPSVNPILEAGGAGEEAVARLCARWLTNWGFEVELSEPASGRFNVVARRGGDGEAGDEDPAQEPARRLLLNGHLDTVGVAGMAEPFAGTVRDGRLYGRGACDMKGGVAAILSAAAALAREAPRQGELIVALTADEEHASLGMAALVGEPGGGGARPIADAAIVCEPTDLAVMPAHKGFLWIELVFRGRAAHGSRPEAGIDAIRHAGRFLAALDPYEVQLMNARPHPLLGYGSIHAGTITGGAGASIYPDRCELVLERRTLPGESVDRVMEEIRAVVEEVRKDLPHLDVEVRPTLSRPGTEVPEEAPLVQDLLSAIEESAGAGRAQVAGMTAWVDAAYLNEAGIPAVCFGPGSILHAHTLEEFAPVEEIEIAAACLERFARRFFERGRSVPHWNPGDAAR